jgi:hypothetical protein
LGFHPARESATGTGRWRDVQDEDMLSPRAIIATEPEEIFRHKRTN